VPRTIRKEGRQKGKKDRKDRKEGNEERRLGKK
jgi:hypothetical protein